MKKTVEGDGKKGKGKEKGKGKDKDKGKGKDKDKGKGKGKIDYVLEAEWSWFAGDAHDDLTLALNAAFEKGWHKGRGKAMP